MTNTILNRRGVPAGLFVSDPRTAEALAAKLAENGIDVVQQTCVGQHHSEHELCAA